MAAFLPGEIVGISKDVVDEDFRRGVGAEDARIPIASCAVAERAKVLRAEACRLLRIAGNSDKLVALESEDAAGISGNAVVEANAPIVGGERVHNCRGKGMNPVGIEKVIGIIICDRELDRNRINRLTVLRVSLRVAE